MTWAHWLAAWALSIVGLVIGHGWLKRRGQKLVDADALALQKTFDRNVLKVVETNKAKIDAHEADREKEIEKMDAIELEREINE